MKEQLRPQMHWVQVIDPVTYQIRLEMHWEIEPAAATPDLDRAKQKELAHSAA